MVHLSTACLFDEQKEYTEEDDPTRGFEGYCGFYVGTKFLSEKTVRFVCDAWILRIRLPFDEFSSPRNYLNKMASFRAIWEQINSLTHRGDFAKTALQMILTGAPYGTYHCVNPGQISAKTVAQKLIAKGIIKTEPEFVRESLGRAPGCRLSTDKLESVGIKLRPVEEAVDDAIENWTTT